MTDERAKEILDFLARKAGFDGFTTHSCYDLNGNLKCIASVSVFNNNYPPQIKHLYAYDENYWVVINMLKKTDYAKALEKMLEWSSKGENVETIDEVYLPAYALLEQIEVEMDLYCHDKK